MDVTKLIKEKVRNIGRLNKDVYIVPDIPEKKMKNVIKAFQCEDFWKSIIAIYDNTIFGAADEGFVFTGERLILREMLSDPITIFYSDLEKVEFIQTYDKKGKENSILKFYFKNGDIFKIENKAFVGEFNYREFESLLNEIIKIGKFEETDQLKEIAEMSEELKILYLKILVNMAYIDDKEIDKKELAELFLLMTRIKMSKESRYIIREYITNINDENMEKISYLMERLQHIVENEEKASFENIQTSLIKDIVNIYFSTKVDKNSYKNIKINDIEFIDNYRYLFNLTNEKLDFILDSIKKEYEILYEDMDDNQIKKQFKELTAKGAAVGVPLAAIYLSGSVVGFSAAGITSGLATLGLGFGMTGGLAAVALIGVLSYKGIKHLTGANEIEKYRFKEMMLQDVLKQTQKTMSFIIEDVNYLITQLNELLLKHETQSQKIQKLVKMIAQFQGALKSVDKKSQTLTNASLKIKCPKYLDIERIREMLSEPTQKDVLNFVLSNYEEREVEENGKLVKKWVLKDNIENNILDELVEIFKNIGYFDVANIATSKLTSTIKGVFK